MPRGQLLPSSRGIQRRTGGENLLEELVGELAVLLLRLALETVDLRARGGSACHSAPKESYTS